MAAKRYRHFGASGEVGQAPRTVTVIDPCAPRQRQALARFLGVVACRAPVWIAWTRNASGPKPGHGRSGSEEVVLRLEAEAPSDSPPRPRQTAYDLSELEHCIYGLQPGTCTCPPHDVLAHSRR